MTNEPHLSVTQLKMYLRCPLQYFFRYICDMRAPPDGGLTLGRVVHETIGDNYRQKIETRQDLPIERLADIFQVHWDQEARQSNFAADEKPEQVKEQGEKMLKKYFKDVAPHVQPVEVEREFLIDTGATDLPLKGYIDLIDDQGTIVDHKTAKRSYSENAAERDLQLTAYALAYRALFGQPESGVRLDVMVRNKMPKIQQLPATRTQADIDRFRRLAQQVEKGINQEIYYPNEGYTCGICGYRDMCAKW